MNRTVLLAPVLLLAACAPATTADTGPTVDLSTALKATATIDGKPTDLTLKGGTTYILTTPNYALNIGLDALTAKTGYGPTEFKISLKNATTAPLKIVWDESAISIDGNSDVVFHNGVKYTDRSSSKPPTIIVPNGQHDDDVLPSGYTSFLASDWFSAPFLTATKTQNATLLLSLDVNGARQTVLVSYQRL